MQMNAISTTMVSLRIMKSTSALSTLKTTGDKNTAQKKIRENFIALTHIECKSRVYSYHSSKTIIINSKLNRKKIVIILTQFYYFIYTGFWGFGVLGFRVRV